MDKDTKKALQKELKIFKTDYDDFNAFWVAQFDQAADMHAVATKGFKRKHIKFMSKLYFKLWRKYFPTVTKVTKPPSRISRLFKRKPLIKNECPTPQKETSENAHKA